jgi:hypothetical protein
MEEQKCILSPARRNRFIRQGYGSYSDKELNDYKYGIRFAYFMCGAIVLTGLLLTNLKFLTAAMIVAFLGTLPPYHPFDYLYNYVIRHLVNKPKMPPRSNQGRFACGIATIWLAGTIYLFHSGLNVFGYISGAILLSLATLVSTTDICIPSIIYNFLFKKGQKKELL